MTAIYYILRKLSDGERAKSFLNDLLQFISVGSVGHNEIVLALEAQCAVSNGCDVIVTRNTDDYIGSAIPVFDPGAFVAMFEG